MNNLNQNNIYHSDYYFKNSLRNKYPKQCNDSSNFFDNDRMGGFLVPFIAGAAISAPFWFIAGNNKQNQQPIYNQPIEYYPVYQPYYPPYYNVGNKL